MSITVLPAQCLGPVARAEAMKFCGSASRLDADKIGWIPLAALDQARVERRLLICYNNGDHVGYLMYNQQHNVLKVFQTWVRADARLILHGRALIDALEHTNRKRPATRITLWCAADLAANHFWAALGFSNTNWRYGPKRTSKRRHLQWQRQVPAILSCGDARQPWAPHHAATPPLLAWQLLPTPQASSHHDTAEGRTPWQDHRAPTNAAPDV